MGEFLVAPIVIFIIAGVIWFVYFSGSVAKQKQRLEELPDDPYQREQAQLQQMRDDHEAARPENAPPPARHR